MPPLPGGQSVPARRWTRARRAYQGAPSLRRIIPREYLALLEHLLDLGVVLVEVRCDPDFALHRAHPRRQAIRPARDVRFRFNRNKANRRFAVAGDHHLLASLRPLDELGE